MSSRQKRAANRANGAKSHGPKTPEGLKKSSMNALRTGIFAKTLVLTNESPELFKELAQTYFDKFQPTDGVEHDLVDELVAAKWRQHRLWMIETAVLDLAMDAKHEEHAKTFSTIDEPTRLALAHKDSMPQLASIERCEGSYRRQYDRALKNLLQLRQIVETPVEPEAAIPAPTTPQPAPPEPVRNEPTAPAPAVPSAPIPISELRNEPNAPAPTALSDMNEEDLAFYNGLTPRLRKMIYKEDAA